METRQRRYVRMPIQIIQIEDPVEKEPKYTKQELRKFLTQRRTVIGPNGEEVFIPKHMAVDDIVNLVREEYGLSIPEITGILVILKHFENNPEFRGKVNRIVASGIEAPLRIERPQAVELHGNREIDENERNIQKPVTRRVIVSENEYRYRSAEINQIIANRYRAEAAAVRADAEARRKQSENLEKQLNEHFMQKEKTRNNRARAGIAVVALFAAIYTTGVMVEMINTTRQARVPGENLKPLKVQSEQDRMGIIQDSNYVTPLVSTPNPTATVAPLVDQTGYESFEYSIDSVSKLLKPNTNFMNVLNKFSEDVGGFSSSSGITSYQEFERMLESGDERLYTVGPIFFADFSRQAVHGMLEDKFEADRVAATYEKVGENNETYEFNIRYFKGGSSDPRTVEGRVNMRRNEEGRLETKEYHKLPYEVYELLATVGEFSDFIGGENESYFDIEGYAARFTDGDVLRAREEIKERMTYGMEAMKSVIKSRAREEQVKEYKGYQR